MLGLTNAIINNLLNNIFHAIWFYALTTEPKHSKGKSILYCILSVVAAEALSLFTIFKFGVESTAFTLLYIAGSLVYVVLYIFVLQGGRKLKSLFVFFSYICVWAAVYVISMVMYSYLFAGWEPSIWIIRTVFNLVLLSLYYLFFKAKVTKSNVAVEKASGTLIVVSGMAYLLLPALMIVYAFNEQSVWSLLATIFLLLFSLAVYLLIFRFIKQLGRENEIKQIEQQNRILQEAVQNSELIEKEAKRTRHDYRHHARTIIDYAKAGDLERVIHHLSDYAEDDGLQELPDYSANPTVNSILRSYVRKATNSGIEMTVSVRMREDTAVTDLDMVSILGNILENAVKGCQAANDKGKLDISIYHKDPKLVIICKNTCDENVRFENNRPVRKNGDGVGVTSIIMTAEHYMGEAKFSVKDSIFTCAVLLNDPQK